MLVLPVENYANLLPRLRAVKFNTFFAEAVLRRCVAGRVWVDDLADPGSFLVAHPCGMSLLCGESEDLGFLAWLVNYLGSGECRRRSEYLQAHPATWARRIPHLLAGRFLRLGELPSAGGDPTELAAATRGRVVQCARRNFRFDPPAFAAQRLDPLRREFRIESMCSRFFDTWGVSVGPRQFWDTAAEFAAHGVAFAVMHGGEPVSMAFSAFAFDDVREIGIETAPAYRGRGLATHAGRAFIEHCLAHSAQPVWSCRQGNVGSERTALRLGFTPSRDLPYYALVTG